MMLNSWGSQVENLCSVTSIMKIRTYNSQRSKIILDSGNIYRILKNNICKYPGIFFIDIERVIRSVYTIPYDYEFGI